MAGEPADALGKLLLDRYRVERVLEGGLGTVFIASDTRAPRRVAIKTPKRALASDSGLLHELGVRFSRESDASFICGNHPNLVTAYDLINGPEPHDPRYLILEYVPGGTLEDRIKMGPLPLQDALRITADVANGMHVAHQHSIIHRDIKPANIFIAEDGRAKVGDFGIAHIESTTQAPLTVLGHPGTPLYMSPEQQPPYRLIDGRSDQYSLGLVLYEMLTGVAYRNVGRLPVREALAVTKRLAALSPSVHALIERMTAEEPNDRYPSMAAVATDVAAVRVTIDSMPHADRRDDDVVGSEQRVERDEKANLSVDKALMKELPIVTDIAREGKAPDLPPVAAAPDIAPAGWQHASIEPQAPPAANKGLQHGAPAGRPQPENPRPLLPQHVPLANGQPWNSAYRAEPPRPEPIDGTALVGFIFAFLLPFVGLPLCIVAFNRIEKQGGKRRSREYARAGIMVSIIYLIGLVIYVIAALAGVSS
jgi:serine/threonine protein kinase